MPTGTVRHFNDEKKYGFITRDDGEDDLFVHVSQVDRRLCGALVKGHRVKFEVGQNARSGKPEAKNVELL